MSTRLLPNPLLLFSATILLVALTTTACRNRPAASTKDPGEITSDTTSPPKSSANNTLNSEAAKEAFLSNCLSSASKGGQLSPEKVKNYCECSLEGFTSDRVTDVDLSQFLSHQANPNKWPKVILDILKTCVKDA